MSVGSGFTFLGLTNIIGRSATVVSAPFTELTDLEGHYLKSEQPSEKARIPTLDPVQSFWKLGFNYTINALDGFVVVGSNLSPDGLWRVVGDSTLQEPVSQYRSTFPTSIVGQFNVTGNLESVYIGPTDPTQSWGLRFNAPPTEIVNGSSNVITGENKAAIVIYAELLDELDQPISNPVIYPAIAVDLYKAGEFGDDVFLRTISHKAVTEESGQYLIFPFDVAEYNDYDTNDIQFRVVSQQGLNGNNNVLYARLVVEKIALLTEALAYDFDTGWMVNSAAVWGYPSDGPLPTTTLQKFLDQSTNLASMFLMFQSDQTITNPKTTGDSTLSLELAVPASLIPTRPRSYIDVGVFIGGPKLTLTNGLRINNSFAPRTVQVDGQSITGQTYGADAFRQLIGPPVELTVTREEGLTILDRVGMRRGKSGAFFVAHDPSLPPEYQVFSSAYVTCAEIGGMEPVQPQQYTTDNQMLFTVRLRFEEKL